jgi:hypothetical protein
VVRGGQPGQRLLEAYVLAALIDPVRRATLRRLYSGQDYPLNERSPSFRTNGYPPIFACPETKGDDDTYERLLASRFKDYDGGE